MDLNEGDFGGAADLIGGSEQQGSEQQGSEQQGSEQQGSEQQGSEQQGGADPEFYTRLSSETGEGESASNLDWVKAKGFKTEDDIIKSLRNAERRISEGGGFKVPGEDATPEDIAAYHAAIGVPEKAEDYTIPQPKDADGNDIPINKDLAVRVTQLAHKHGVPKGALDAVLDEEIKAQIAEYDEIVKAQEKAAGEHVKGWGEEKDAKLAQVNAAAKDLGLTRQDMQYLRGMPGGAGKALDMLAKFGQNFSEDTLIKGDNRSFGMTGEQAQAEIDAIKADKAVFDKAVVPGTAENQRYNRALEALAADADKKAAGR